MKSKNLQLLLGLIIAGVALHYTFRGVSFSEIFENIISLKIRYLPLAVGMLLLGFVVRAYRWQALLNAVKPIPSARLYSPLFIGFMGNLLPLRAGEFIRAFLLGRREDIGFSASFATVVVDRLFDLLAVLLLLAGMLAFEPDSFVPKSGAADPRVEGAIRSFGFASLGTCLGIIIFCFCLVKQRTRTLRFVRFFAQMLPRKVQGRIEDVLQSFTDGLGVLRDPKGLMLACLLTIVLWVVMALGNLPIYYCYQLHDSLPIQSLAVLVVMIAIAVMIPTPGFVGPFQFAITFVLNDLYGIDRTVAVSFSLVVWFLQMGTVFLAGLFFIVRDNVSFFSISRTAKRTTEATQKPNPRY